MRSRSLVPAILFLCAAAALSAPPAELPLEGRIVNAEGRGVAGVSVRLLEARREFEVAQWSFEDRVHSSVVATTDEHGFFDTVIRPDPDYRSFWLRFYDPDRFDVVRYRLPGDRDITARVRRGRPVVETIVLEDHADWPKVRGWIQRLGADSDRGRVVRRLGIPDRRERSDGRESFWYSRAGVVYRFEDGRFVGEERIAAGEDAP